MNLNPRFRSSAGLTAVGLFLSFASLIALLAGISLVWTGTALDQIWRLNPSAYQHLAALGKLVGISFLVLSALLGIAAVGWFQRRLWGWRLAVAIIATQVLGDVVNLVLGHFLQGATGVLIAGALLLYLLRPQIRAAFLTRMPVNQAESVGRG
jgi:hypothetical protein